MVLSARISDGHSDLVRRFILPSMRRDECHLIIRSDKLLMTFAAIELEKREPERYCDVSYSLRILAKLILSHREIHQNCDFNAKDIVLHKNYDDVKNVIKRMAGYKQSSYHYQNKICHEDFGYNCQARKPNNWRS